MLKPRLPHFHLLIVAMLVCLGIVWIILPASSQDAATPILIESDAAAVAQAGLWTRQDSAQASGGSYLYSSGPDDALTLNFAGTTVEIVYVEHEALATLVIEIDNVVVRTVATNAEATAFAKRAVIDYLENTAHILRVYGAGGAIAVDAFVAAPYTRPMQPTAGVVWYVNGTTGNNGNTCLAPTTACLTITAAIGKATNDDTIMIAAGTYNEALTIGKNLTLSGANQTNTFLDGTGLNSSIVQIAANTTVTLDKLTIRNGSAAGPVVLQNGNARYFGGAIVNHGTLLLTFSTVSNNVLTNYTVGSLTYLPMGAGIFNDGTLTIEDSSVSQNTIYGLANGGGAGIFTHQGVLTIRRSLLDSNGFSPGTLPLSPAPESSQGGAIASILSLVTIEDSTVSNNWAEAGGGVYTTNEGITTIRNTLFVGNVAMWVRDCQVYTCGTTAGGAILHFGLTNSAELLLLNSVIRNNAAIGTGSLGGGLHITSGPITIQDSVIADNVNGGITTSQAGFIAPYLNINRSQITGNTGQGGLFINASHNVNIANSTISGNSTIGSGGGIYFVATSWSLTLSNVTISNNTADSDQDGVGDGGGLYVGSQSKFHSKNSIVAGNFDRGGQMPDCAVSTTRINTYGYNIVGRNNGCEALFPVGAPNANNDVVGSNAAPINAQLAPLGDNGGYTYTHALLPGSIAIDRVPLAACTYFSLEQNPLYSSGSPILNDQRSVERQTSDSGSGCDSGAYEINSGTPLPTNTPTIVPTATIPPTETIAPTATCLIPPTICGGDGEGCLTVPQNVCPSATPGPSQTPSSTATQTATATRTATVTSSATPTATATSSATPTQTATATNTPQANSVIPISPIDIGITSRQPSFKWHGLVGAQWYRVWIQMPNGTTALDQWLQNGNGVICDSSQICTFWPVSPLGNAVANTTLLWSIQAYGTSFGMGPLAGPHVFTITAAAPQSPNGTISEGYPTFQWTHNADATLYQVYVGGPNGSITEWVNASQKCSGATCASTLTASLNGVGAYQWYVQGYSADGFGAWGGPGVFTLAGSPPPMINKTSPGQGAGFTSTAIPFVWQANASATSYELFVSGPNGWSDYRAWDAAANCNASTCSISISVPSVGGYTWYLRGKNAAGFGPWGPNDAGGNLGARSFTVQIGVPGSVVPQSPVNTTVNTGQVAFSWQAVANATAYELYVAGPNSWVNFQTWQAATTCTPGCTVNLMLPSNGGYTWYLRASGPGGSGAWSSGAAFSVSTTLPGAVTKQSPAQGGNVTTLAVALTWAKVANANAYEVFLSGPGGFVHFQQHVPGQSATCDASTCATTIYVPSQGSYQWYMRAWNPAGFGVWGPNQGSGDFDLRTFTVNPTAPAANPVLITPANGSSVTAGGAVRFEWSAASNATWYLVVLVNRNTGAVVSRTWVSGANGGCGTGGTCGTSIAAVAGAYRWAVLTWGPGSTSVPTYQAGVTPTFTFDKLAS